MHRMVIRSLTPGRAFNFLLLFLSYHLSRFIRKPLHWGHPAAIAIEPTTSCNLRCPECPSGLRSFTRETGMLKDELFKRVIDEVAGQTLYLTLYFQGEPFLNPAVYKMIRYAKSKRMMVVTSTNAHYLDEANCRKIIESGLDKLIVSVDGATQESYARYRIGGSLQKVKEGVKLLSEMKKKMGSSSPLISMQTVVFSTNEHELDDIRSLADSCGADEIKFKSAQIYDYDNGNPLIPANEAYSRYIRNKNGNYVLKGGFNNECWKMWSSTVITWDGKVVPCCFDKDAAHKLGDLSNSNLKSIWKKSEYKAFRRQVLLNRKAIDICSNCSEGSEVFFEN